MQHLTAFERWYRDHPHAAPTAEELALMDRARPKLRGNFPGLGAEVRRTIFQFLRCYPAGLCQVPTPCPRPHRPALSTRTPLPQGCIRREGAPEAVRQAVRQAVGGAVGGGYCRLQMPLKLALDVGGTVAVRRRRPRGPPPPLLRHPCPSPPPCLTGGGREGPRRSHCYAGGTHPPPTAGHRARWAMSPEVWPVRPPRPALRPYGRVPRKGPRAPLGLGFAVQCIAPPKSDPPPPPPPRTRPPTRHPTSGGSLALVPHGAGPGGLARRCWCARPADTRACAVLRGRGDDDDGVCCRDALGRGEVPPLPPLQGASLCTATVPLTPSASLNGICNRQ